MIRTARDTTRPVIELADILRRHGGAYLRLHADHLGRVERRVVSAIIACRDRGARRSCRDLRQLPGFSGRL
jgi:hypothetical protein